jgi:hypothetical protein
MKILNQQKNRHSAKHNRGNDANRSSENVPERQNKRQPCNQQRKEY